MKKLRNLGALVLVMALLAGCTGNGGSGDDNFYIGIIVASGANALVGQYTQNGANMAADEINAAGGILGRQVVLVIGDEIDSLQASVDATNALLFNDDLSAIVGSMYSQFALGAMPRVYETGIPFFAQGSSSGISNEGNPYVWQVRPIDTFQGLAIAEFAVNVMGVQNPAIMFSTQHTFASLAEQTIVALQDLGVTITDANRFGFPEEETNYLPYFAQILAGDFDAIIAMANQMPSALIMEHAVIAGVDPQQMPLIGSTSFGSNVAITTAGASSNYWYSITDWVPGGHTPAGRAFEDAYVARFGEPSDLPAVIWYDAIMLIRHAAEAAGSTDRDAINNALHDIRNFPGAMGYFSYFPDQVFSTALNITRNMDQQVTLIEGITFREP
ncbi:MAG: ABC transporter substrate-binding protein [Defluviitaleaceae bacterium]|nr:ABC transporter substrate-binding protein [Defluviitaleaceae bacterium]